MKPNRIPTLVSLIVLFLLAGTPALAQGEPNLDAASLRGAGWSQIEEGFWQRQTPEGTQQSLAFGPGKMLMVPGLQAEVDRLVASFKQKPTAATAQALEILAGHMAALLTPQGGAPLKAAAKPPSTCQPWNFDHGLLTFAYAPPGWHSVIATASAWWDGGGLWCPGHIYTSASYALTPTGGSTLADFDWCATDDNYEGSCSATVSDPWAGPYSACTSNAYAYMTVFNGLYVLSESKSWGTC